MNWRHWLYFRWPTRAMLIKYIDKMPKCINKVVGNLVFDFRFFRFHFRFSCSVSFSMVEWICTYGKNCMHLNILFCSNQKNNCVCVLLLVWNHQQNSSLLHINRMWTHWIQTRQFEWAKSIPKQNKTKQDNSHHEKYICSTVWTNFDIG